MNKIFLGGTCNGSTWRDKLIPFLTCPYFNPVVKDWTPECQAREISERESADIVLYVITPKMTGVYSIAEVIDDSNKRPYKTIFCLVSEDEGQVFSSHQSKSLMQVGAMVERNGGTYIHTLDTTFFNLAQFLNNFK
jgi:hypothetical protein